MSFLVDFPGKKDFGWDSCTDGKVKIFFCAQGLLSFTESNILSLLASLRLNPKSSKIGDFISRLKYYRKNLEKRKLRN